MKHLFFGDAVWCPEAEDAMDVTDDPRDATCSECLKHAAEYGAAAAMRYAAVTAGVTHDPELERERDEAIKRVQAINNALEKQNAFFCNDCMKLYSTRQRGLSAGGASWCVFCAPKPELAK